MPTVSFVDVLRNRVRPATFTNKVVVVGVTAPVGGDLRRTSAAGGSTLPGPEIQADMIGTIHRDVPLRDAPAGVVVALIVLVGVLSAAVSLLPRRWRLPAFAAAVVLLAIAVQLSFDAGAVLPAVALAAVLVVGGIGGLPARRGLRLCRAGSGALDPLREAHETTSSRSIRSMSACWSSRKRSFGVSATASMSRSSGSSQRQNDGSACSTKAA